MSNLKAERFSEEEIRARFQAAEQYCDKLEEELLEACPEEVIEKFRIGEERVLFRTLLIAPGMELEEGVLSIQSDSGWDVDLGLAKYVNPPELVLECGGRVPCKYWVRVRRESPTVDRLMEEPVLAIREPKSVKEIEDWVRAIEAMGAFTKE